MAKRAKDTRPSFAIKGSTSQRKVTAAFRLAVHPAAVTAPFLSVRIMNTVLARKRKATPLGPSPRPFASTGAIRLTSLRLFRGAKNAVFAIFLVRAKNTLCKKDLPS